LNKRTTTAIAAARDLLGTVTAERGLPTCDHHVQWWRRLCGDRVGQQSGAYFSMQTATQ